MSAQDEWLILVVILGGVAFTSGAAAASLLRRRLNTYGPGLVRMNVRGIPVPVVLGDAFAGGSLAGVAVLLLLSYRSGGIAGDTVAVVIALGVMWAAGAWDDRRGDELARGFKGHLGALRSRSVTGGLVKIGAGVVAGLAAAAFLPARGASPAAHVIETVALVALTANLVNLFDRAPGRAGKVALLIGLPLGVAGDLQWAISATPVLGALLFCLAPDLREKAMLGDAGANPLGAVIGVGLVASLGEPGRLLAIGALLVLTAASERWSFSKAIDGAAPLRWLDRLGRRDELAPK